MLMIGKLVSSDSFFSLPLMFSPNELINVFIFRALARRPSACSDRIDRDCLVVVSASSIFYWPIMCFHDAADPGHNSLDRSSTRRLMYSVLGLPKVLPLWA